jgi:hypothetical protein
MGYESYKQAKTGALLMLVFACFNLKTDKTGKNMQKIFDKQAQCRI